jgi:nucleotide-binding universal stress UspA family protein
MKTILLATDGSEAATEALDFAIQLARETGSELELLAVRPPRVPSKGGAAPPIFEVEEPGGAERIVAAAGQRGRAHTIWLGCACARPANAPGSHRSLASG